MIGGFWMRLVLSLILLAVTFAVEFAALRASAKRTRQLRRIMARSRARLDKALRLTARKNAESLGGKGGGGASSHSSSKPASPEVKQAKKDWARAQLVKHSKNPDWKADADYLTLLLSSARGGCAEAMNKLGKYAFGKRAYVEAYYWALKLEMAGARNTGEPPSSILRHWLKHRSPKKRHRLHEGFRDEQYRFARAVMRIRSGVDREKGLLRLRLLVDAGYEDVRQFVRKNGLEDAVNKVEVPQMEKEAAKTL